MGVTIAIDFGSTYTKVVAVDLDKEELVGVTQSPSTVDTDMTIALHKALIQLKSKLGVEDLQTDRIVASSGAAGGLNVVVAGLVRALTIKTAEERLWCRLKACWY
jgi:sugar (pentulose or hexulose) kinase